MKKQKQIIVLLVLVTLLSITGCSKGKSSESSTNTIKPTSTKVTTGKVEGLSYTNEFFGLSIQIPDKWAVQDKQSVDEMQEVGKDAVAGDDKELKKALDESKNTSLNLLTVFQHPLGSNITFNPSFVSIAENVSQFPSIKTGKEYLEGTKEILKKAQVEYVFGKDIYEEKIDGISFNVMELSVTVNNIKIFQKYYSTITNKYSLNFIITYTTDEELKSVQQVLNSIKFAK